VRPMISPDVCPASDAFDVTPNITRRKIAVNTTSVTKADFMRNHAGEAASKPLAHNAAVDPIMSPSNAAPASAPSI
jgi:hypothetical protein